MHGRTRVSGFSLVEVLVAICVIAVLAGILVPTLSYARNKTQTTRCVANLTHIAVATELYYEDHHGPPLTTLPVALRDYVDSASAFVCPKDKGGTDSYSAYYVARGKPGSGEFVVGCPRHGHSDRGAVAFGKAQSDDAVLASVSHDGAPVAPGEVVTGGQLAFADGSKVTIAEGGQVGLLMSFTDDGVCHSVIYVPKASFTTIRCEVTPGSRFEVVTPASIAGVEGTKFDVTTSWEYDAVGNVKYTTDVQVHEGKVKVTDRAGHGKKIVPPGQAKKGKVHKPKAPNDPGNGNGNGNGNGR